MSPDIIPYLPSGQLWRCYLEAILAGGADDEDIPFLQLSRVEKPRQLARSFVPGAGNQPPVMLSVAIEGGSSIVKRGRPLTWQISDHGRWRRMHLGAIDAAFGSTPYFRHLFPMIEEAIMSAEAGTPFYHLTEHLHHISLDFMEFKDTARELQRLRNDNPDKFNSIAREFSESADTTMAFIDVMFRKGRDSIFTLLPQV